MILFSHRRLRRRRRSHLFFSLPRREEEEEEELQGRNTKTGGGGGMHLWSRPDLGGEGERVIESLAGKKGRQEKASGKDHSETKSPFSA